MRERRVQVPSLQGLTYEGRPAPGWTGYVVFKCSICKRIRQSTSPHVTGYGIETRGHRKIKVCFACCGDRDLKALETGDRATLYVVTRKDGYHITNWPGTLDIKAYYSQRGDHNFAGRNARLDVWFMFNGTRWHGVNIGDNDILRCKRVKGH